MNDSNLSMIMPPSASGAPVRSALVAFLGTDGQAQLRLLRSLQAGGFQICGLAALPNVPQTTLILVDLQEDDPARDGSHLSPADPLPAPGTGRLSNDTLLKASEVVSTWLHQATPEHQTIGLPLHPGDLHVPHSPQTAETPAPDCPNPGRAIQVPHKFSRREIEVIEQLIAGKPNKIIAFELGISEATTKVHMRNIMRKLGATNRTQAAQSFISLRLSGRAF